MKVTRLGTLLGIFTVLGLLGYAFVSNSSSARFDAAAFQPGRPAPNFAIKLFSGDTFSLADQRGKVVVVNFWASWCPPCRQEAPVLERAWQSGKDRGVVLVGINEQDSEQGALSFIKEFNITFPTGPDPTGNIARAYGLTGYPETSFIDRDGKLVRRWIGPLTDQQMSAFVNEASR